MSIQSVCLANGLKFTTYAGYHFADNIIRYDYSKTATVLNVVTDLEHSSTGIPMDQPITGTINYFNGRYDLNKCGIIVFNDLFNNRTVEFIGYFKPTSSGNYNWILQSDDKSFLWIGDNARYATAAPLMAASAASSNQYKDIDLSAGVYYPIRILYGQGNADIGLTLGFKLSSNTDYTYSGSGYYFNLGNTYQYL